MTERKKLTPISELGEFGLITRLTRDFKAGNPSTVLGVGDDAAVVDYKGAKMVLTTDLLVEGIHFNLVYTPLKHLGYKAIAVNLSDVFAMYAIPRQVTVSIAVSGKFSVEALEELYDGIGTACRHYGVDMVGGDTTSSLTGLAISVTALGELDEEGPVLRSTAAANDLVCVSGNLGAAYMGLQLLEREKKILDETDRAGKPDFSGHETLLERQLKPEARGDILEALKDAKIRPNSMIDVSDGLSSDLLHICRQSGLGCRIFQDKIPMDREMVKAAEEMGIEPFICALNGGEDYELLFTVPLEVYDRVLALGDVCVIGHITEAKAGCKFITSQESEFDLKAQGWDPL
jgi:thiamine-monophosphate kinase